MPLGSGLGGNTGGATSIVAHENVLNRMSADRSGAAPRARAASWPSDTFFEDENDFFFNDEAVQVLHQPNATGDGDSIVFFRKSDVDRGRRRVLHRVTYPVFDRAQGGSINGVIAALNRIIRLTVPTHNQEGGTMVVPGHGRLSDEMDVVEYRNMLTIVRDRIQALVAEGKTLEQVRASQPTLDYDARYGAASGPASPDAFVAAVYDSLRAARPPQAAEVARLPARPVAVGLGHRRGRAHSWPSGCAQPPRPVLPAPACDASSRARPPCRRCAPCARAPRGRRLRRTRDVTPRGELVEQLLRPVAHARHLPAQRLAIHQASGFRLDRSGYVAELFGKGQDLPLHRARRVGAPRLLDVSRAPSFVSSYLLRLAM